MTTPTQSLKHWLLVAMPTLSDPNFQQSVIYLCEHDDEGAMGLIINKPLRITLGEVLSQLDIHTDHKLINSHPVLMGGPIAQEQGFVLHQGEQPFREDITNPETGITVSSSKEILIHYAKGEGPDTILVTLGYTGWSKGQLEQELATNSWLIAPAKEDIIFKTPFNQRWRAAAALVGVDFDKLSSEIGHA